MLKSQILLGRHQVGNGVRMVWVRVMVGKVWVGVGVGVVGGGVVGSGYCAYHEAATGPPGPELV